MIKKIIAVIIVIVGILLGLYTGLKVMFIGGIIDVVEQIKATNLDGSALAVGIVKILFAGVVGWVIFYISIFIAAIVNVDLKKKRKKHSR
jgi:hypothetical protein